MRVYKVVLNKGGRLVSSLARGKAQVEYRPGKWSKAPRWLQMEGYHLLVFDNKEDALIYLLDTPGGECWEAEGEEEVPLPYSYLLVDLEKGWPKEDWRGKGWEWPRGTKMFKRVRLIRRVA